VQHDIRDSVPRIQSLAQQIDVIRTQSPPAHPSNSTYRVRVAQPTICNYLITKRSWARLRRLCICHQRGYPLCLVPGPVRLWVSLSFKLRLRMDTPWGGGDSSRVPGERCLDRCHRIA